MSELNTQVHELTCRSITVRADSINEENRSVEAVLSTDGRVSVYDWRSGEIIEEMLLPEGAEHPGQVVLLDSHSRWSVASVRGSIRDIRVEGNQLVGRLYVAKDDEECDRAWNLIRQRHLTDVSIGYRSLQYVDLVPNSTQVINGRSYSAGQRKLRVTTRYSLQEGSLVPIGADAAAKIREEHRLSKRVDMETKEVKDGARSEPAATDATPRDTQVQPVESQRAALSPAHQPAVIPAEAQGRVDVPDLLRRERQRVEMCRSAVIEGVDEPLIQRAINEEWDEARVNREYLAAHRKATTPAPITGAPAGHVHSRETDVTTRSLAAGLLHRIGAVVAGATIGFGRSRLTDQDAEMGDRFSDMSLFDMCREAVRIDGGRDPVSGMQPYGRGEFIRAAVSSPTFSNIFTTSVNARMLAGYEEADDTTDWCSEEDVSDFKTNERIGLGKHSNLKKLPAGGTADHSTVSDNVESYKIARYARQFFMDEQDILSDNMDAIQNTPFEMGNAAKRLRPDLVYAVFLQNPDMRDGVALFHSTHANTATNALATSTSLPAAVAAMYAQVEDSVRLNLRPKYLIVNPTLEGTARQLVNSELLITGSDVTVGNLNWLKQLGMQVRVEGRIDATGVTNPSNETAYTGSTTTWFCAAQSQRTIRVGYLAGTGRRPQIRRSVLDRGQWGIGWDINMDIGVKALDWRGLYRGNT